LNISIVNLAISLLLSRSSNKLKLAGVDISNLIISTNNNSIML